MDKDIFDMLNDSKIDLDNYKIEDLNDIEKQKMKNNFRKSMHKGKKKGYQNGIVASALVVGLIVGVFITNMGGQVLAGIKILTSDISSRLGIERDLDSYKTVVDKAISKKGITIQLNEVILNGNELVVSSTVKSNEEKLKEVGIHSFGDVYVNGKEMSSGAGGGAKQIDEYTMEETMTYTLENDLTNGDIDIMILYSEVMMGDKFIKGPWIFEFKVNGDELAIDTKEITLEHKFTLENGQDIILERYTTNDLGQKIYFTKSTKGTEYDVKLEGTDDLGNEVEFYLSRSTPKDGLFKIDNLNGELSEKAKTLKLIPYAVAFPKESGKLSNDFKQVGDEFIINIAK